MITGTRSVGSLQADATRASIAQATTRGRTAVVGVAAFIGLSAFGLAYSTGGFSRFDEAWFLAVVARVHDGAVLYRDVWYGTGPLPVYAADAVTWITGVDVIAVKVVVAAAFAASSLLAWHIAARLGIGRGGRILVVAALAYFSPALPLSAYGLVTTAFVMAALLAALIWQQAEQGTRRGVAAFAGGAACGFAFGSKENIGVYALAALVTTYVLDAPRDVARLGRAVALAVAGFITTVLLALLPVLASGGLGTYVRREFTDKTTYLAHASLSYTHSLRLYAHDVANLATEADREAAYWSTGIVLPALSAIAVLVIAVLYRRADRRAIPIVAFALVSAASLYPRSDYQHVANAAGPLLLACAYAVHLLLRSARREIVRVATVTACVWLGAAVLLTIGKPLRLMRSPRADLSTLPHFRGTFVDVEQEAEYKAEAGVIASAGRVHGPVFLLMPDAGFRYLTSGLRNPTAYDYPLVTAFGPSGQTRVRSLLSTGRIHSVCYRWWTSGFLPSDLVSYLHSSMKQVRDLGPCTLYTR